MKMLDFNAIQQPTWQLKLKDDAQTVVNLSVPSVDLMDRLEASIPEFQEITKNKDGRAIRKLYDLVAEVFNCNDDGLTFTGEELRTKYRMSLLDLAKFELGYLDFIGEIKEAKN